MSSFLRRLPGILSVTTTAICTALVVVVPTRARAADDSGGRARLASNGLRATPLKLSGGSQLTVISPERWSDLADELIDTLRAIHQEYTTLFGPIPSLSSSIRLLDEDSFFDLTGAPSWTNALYYRGEILIPLSLSEPIDLENLYRSVRHEYTHAVISALSGGRAPGWLDEGIAQWAEGTENPALNSALEKWLSSNDPVPLRFLQGGFTKLNQAMVPAAYAESLYAADSVIKVYGFKRVGAYFSALRKGLSKDDAFVVGFGIAPDAFEDQLDASLKRWSAARHKHGDK